VCYDLGKSDVSVEVTVVDETGTKYPGGGGGKKKRQKEGKRKRKKGGDEAEQTYSADSSRPRRSRMAMRDA
jgi:hypothetical protein